MDTKLLRYLQQQVLADLDRKMVFLGGPRQVGKTTLAKNIMDFYSTSGHNPGQYLSYDIPQDRQKILKHELEDVEIVVFDEIHKYRQWRNYLKGIYDQYQQSRKILVTGSARLDLYRFGGDSLQGRYHYLRLLPLSVKELGITTHNDLLTLYQLGGFPEPFFSGDETQARRWSLEYRNRLIQEDVEKLEHVKDLGTLELLMIRLPDLVGSPLSLNSIREDLQVSHGTVSRWLDMLERLYSFIRLSPFGSTKIKAVRKEQKHYHFDWQLIPHRDVRNTGARFENLIAIHLLKWVYYQYDCYAKEYELRYFRDIDGREVDFVIVEKGKPIMAVEVKLIDEDISKHLKYFKAKFPDCRAVQVYLNGTKDYLSKEDIRVIPAVKFLDELA